MTLKTSLNSINPATNLYRFTVKKNMGLVALITTFLLLACPGYVLMYVRRQLEYAARESTVFSFDMRNITISCGVALTVITVISAVIMCFVNFSFLYSKKSGDVYHSLPLTRTELFFSRFLSAITPLLIPLVLCYGSLALFPLMRNVTGDFKLVLNAFILNIAVVLVCSSFAVIFLICAGTPFNLLLSGFGINGGILLAVLSVIAMSDDYLYGYSPRNVERLFSKVSPFWFAFYGYSRLISEEKFFGREFYFYLLKSAIVIAASLALAVLLYRRRKSEKCGDSYAYSFVYIICSFIVSFVCAYGLGMIFTEGNNIVLFWPFAAAGAALASITFGAITDRGFKTIKKSVAISACSLACLLAVHVVLWTGAFGYEKRVPEAGKIKSITVNAFGEEISYKNPQAVLQLHKALVEDGESIDDGSNIEYYGNIAIDYTLKNGTVISRAYDGFDMMRYEKQMLALYKGEERRAAIQKLADGLTAGSISISRYGHGKYGSGEDISDDFGDVSITKKEMQQILDAYYSDLSKATVNSLSGTDVVNYSFFGKDGNGYYKSFDLWAEDSFTETKQVVESLDLKQRFEKIQEGNIEYTKKY